MIVLGTGPDNPEQVLFYFDIILALGSFLLINRMTLNLK